MTCQQFIEVCAKCMINETYYEVIKEASANFELTNDFENIMSKWNILKEFLANQSQIKELEKFAPNILVQIGSISNEHYNNIDLINPYV